MQSFGGALVEGCFLDLYGRFVEDALRCGCSAVDLLRFFSGCLSGEHLWMATSAYGILIIYILFPHHI